MIQVPPIVVHPGEQLKFSLDGPVLTVKSVQGQGTQSRVWAETQVRASLVQAHPVRTAELVRADLDSAIQQLKR